MILFLSSIVAAGQTFTCTPTAVWDGDGPIWCVEGPRIRIAGVAAREIDETCQATQPCPPVGGVDARDRLVALFGGPKGRLEAGHVKVRSAPMRCISEGSAGGNRTAAWCRSPAFGDLSCAVVRQAGQCGGSDIGAATSASPKGWNGHLVRRAVSCLRARARRALRLRPRVSFGSKVDAASLGGKRT